MNIAAIIAMLIMIISFLLFFIFIFIKFYKIKNKSNGYKKIRGKCVDYNKVFMKNSISDVGEWRKYPIVIYEVDNRQYQVTGQTAYGLGTPLKNIKFTVFYNPNDPNDAILADQHRWFLIILIGLLLGIVCILYFLINNLILGNNMKIYTYQIKCNYKGYVYDEIEETEAKSRDEALNLIKEKYKNWPATCEFEEVNKYTD